ncbi:MAG: hypothetical protein IT381_15650 [Deltaproteobacteria bacterium]|nr:hypothetical protein [Deltaproteobacteria bacterium]
MSSCFERAARALPFALLAACILSVTSEREKAPPIVLDAAAIVANVCAGDRIELRFGGDAPGIGFDGSRVIPPAVTLTNGTVTIPMAASWRADLSVVEANVESANVPPGVYAVEVESAGGAQRVLLNERVTVRARPIVSEVVGAAVCDAPATPQTVTIKGSALAGTTTRLAGVVAPLTTAINATGTEIVATIPSGLASGMTYPIIVGNGTGCEAVAPMPLAVVAPPETSALLTGPSLLSMTQALQPQATGAVPVAVRASLRISGTGFVPGTRVFAGAVEASGVTITPDGLQIDASIEPSTLAPGSHDVRVTVGACTSTLSTPLVIATPALPLDRMVPDAIASSGEKFLVDALGNFAAAGQGLLFYVDVDPDPFAVSLVPLRYDVRLDGSRSAVRLRADATTPSGGPYDVHVLSFASGGAAVAGMKAAALRSTNIASIPRIVHKSKEWIGASGAALTVYGCGFDATQFSLVPEGGGTPIPLAGATIASASSWATNRLRCRIGTAVTQEASWTGLSIAPGIYRLRADRTVGSETFSHEDLYPLAVYRDAPDTQSAQLVKDAANADVKLKLARKAAAALTAVDPTGRKYLYVVGGSDRSDMTPRQTVAFDEDMTSYEFTALDRAHRFVGFERGPQPNLPKNVAAWGFFFNQDGVNTRQTMPHFGHGMVADGPFVYVAGGIESGGGAPTVRDGIFQSRVAHEEDGVPTLSAAPTVDAVGVLAAGVHHYRIAAYYAAEHGTHGFVETIPSDPVTVTLAAPGRVRFSVKAPCGPAPGPYQGYPTIRVFRSDDARRIPDESFQFGYVATTSPDVVSNAACVAGATYLVDDVGADATPNPKDIPIIPGLLYDFRKAAAALPSARAGVGLDVVAGNFGPRSLVSFGGSDNGTSLAGSLMNDVTRVDVLASGALGPSATAVTPSATPVAFAFAPARDEGTRVDIVLGVKATEVNRVARLTGTTLTGSDLTGLRNTDVEAGFAFLRAGQRAFLLGGVDNTTSSPNVSGLFASARPRKHAFGYVAGDPAPAAVATGALLRRRAYAASVHVPPFVYVAGGVVCTADAVTPVANPAAAATDCDAAGEMTLTDTIEVLTLQ